MVFSPMILLSLVICAAGTICLLKVMKMPLIIGQLTLKYRDKCVVLLVLCLVFLTFTGTLIRLIWTSFVVAFICGLHMLFRPRSVTAKTCELHEELKLRGFSWLDSVASSEMDIEINQMDAIESYSAVVDNDADIRKRVQRSTANGLP